MLRMVSNPVASWSEDFYDEPIVVYRGLGSETAFVMDPELIQQILLDDSESFGRMYERVLGRGGSEGVIIAEGERWRWQRALLAPLFRAEELVTHVPSFVSAAEELICRWGNTPSGSLQDIHNDMAQVALQVLEDTVLGAGLSQEDHRLVAAAVIDFLKPLTWKAAYAALKLPASTPHPGRAKRARAIHDLSDVAARAIARARQNGTEGTAVLGRMVAARDPATGEAMPDTLIIDNMMIFLLAGHETTANALTWTLYLLAMFPEWQERARAAIGRVAASGTIGPKEIEQLDILDEIFQEAMRLYPPAATLMRKTRKPVTLGSEELGQGATIVIPIYVIHRHRQIWQDPLRFDPSRFKKEVGIKRHRCAYMPFGAGPRTCLGAAFSMLEGKTLLAALLARARFELPEGEVPFPLVRLTLRPKHGLKLKVTMLAGERENPVKQPARRGCFAMTG
jgi:cytochrome P450